MTHRGPFQPLTFCDSVLFHSSTLLLLFVGKEVQDRKQGTFVGKSKKLELSWNILYKALKV